MKIGAIILSRFSSSRLPGKALMKINDKPVLKYIIERLLCVFDESEIIIATSRLKSDNVIAEFAKSHNIHCFRGSLENVADRFLKAAQSLSLDYAVRINGDNIFTDVNILQQMVSLSEEENYSFISNVKNRTFPKGMSIEIVKVSHYQTLMAKINISIQYKEHVTLYLYDHILEAYHFIYNKSYPEFSGIQMALDTKEDFERTENIIGYFNKPHWEYNMKEIFQIISDKNDE